MATTVVLLKKGQFSDCVNSIITQFGFAHPVCKLQLLVTHGYSFYGSSLWDLYDNDSKRLYVTWNIAVCRLYNFLGQPIPGVYLILLVYLV